MESSQVDSVNMAEHFDCLSSFLVLDSIPVEKYRSKRTGINFCFAKVPGPLVNGFLCLGRYSWLIKSVIIIKTCHVLRMLFQLNKSC